ncbi:hypothetical protein ADK87_00025 [Streptomyces sp. NRRL F-4711]|nr:hypothetical protein ADK87_00025 [Streptomyces sp. NRRL F-4711]
MREGAGRAGHDGLPELGDAGVHLAHQTGVLDPVQVPTAGGETRQAEVEVQGQQRVDEQLAAPSASGEPDVAELAPDGRRDGAVDDAGTLRRVLLGVGRRVEAERALTGGA